MQTHLDLFSGIGGFALACSWLGIDTIGFCEIDPWCRKVLAKNFPGVPQHDDARTLTADIVRGWLRGTHPDNGRTVHDTDNGCERPHYEIRSGRSRPECASEPTLAHANREGESWFAFDESTRRGVVVQGGIDLITAGYPCQPFSHAGKRLGQEDDRHLWPEVARLVADLRPRWCLFENVAGHISMGLDDVLSDLETLGYACRPVVVPACAVNAPHRRDRVWIVAHAGSGESEQRCDPNVLGRRQEQAKQIGMGGGGITVPYFTVSRLQERNELPPRRQETGTATATHQRRQALGGLGLSADGLSVGLARPVNVWEPGWEDGVSRTTEHEVDRVNKLKALGNAIVPQVAYVILSSMQGADK